MNAIKKDVWFKEGIELNEDHIDGLVHILTKRCGDKVKKRIRSLVTYDLTTLIKNVSWLDRFYVCGMNDVVRYNAGQSYPCEIKAIRNEMIRRYP